MIPNFTKTILGMTTKYTTAIEETNKNIFSNTKLFKFNRPIGSKPADLDG